MLLRIEPDAWFFLVGTGRAGGQGAGTGVFPQGLERFLQLLVGHVRAQRYVAMDMDFKGSVVARHAAILTICNGPAGVTNRQPDASQ